MLLLYFTANCLFNWIDNTIIDSILQENNIEHIDKNVKYELSRLLNNYKTFTDLLFDATSNVLKIDKEHEDEIDGYLFDFIDDFSGFIDNAIAIIQKDGWCQKKICKLEKENGYAEYIRSTIKIYMTEFKDPLKELNNTAKNLEISGYKLNFSHDTDKAAIIETLKYLKSQFLMKEAEMLQEETKEKEVL